MLPLFLLSVSNILDVNFWFLASSYFGIFNCNYCTILMSLAENDCYFCLFENELVTMPTHKDSNQKTSINNDITFLFDRLKPTERFSSLHHQYGCTLLILFNMLNRQNYKQLCGCNGLFQILIWAMKDIKGSPQVSSFI